MRRPIVTAAIVTLLTVAGCKGREGPSHLRLVNAGTKTLQCDILAGVNSADLRKNERIARVKLEPGESSELTPAAGPYTLFPMVWMFQGTKGLAYYPFRLRAGKTLTITLNGVARPTFTGSAWALDYKANSGSGN